MFKRISYLILLLMLFPVTFFAYQPTEHDILFERQSGSQTEKIAMNEPNESLVLSKDRIQNAIKINKERKEKDQYNNSEKAKNGSSLFEKFRGWIKSKF